MSFRLMTRCIKVGDDEYIVPTDLVIMYVNGIPFAHFSLAYPTCYDESIMNDYSICVEEMPDVCPPYLEKYIQNHFFSPKGDWHLFQD
jgi:hypothetical protein